MGSNLAPRPRLAFLALATLICSSATLHADDILSLAGSPTAAGNNYTYTYSYNATVTNSLQAGDSFTLYDVSGYYAGSLSALADFSPSVQLVTTPPSLIIGVADSSALFNITETYTGPSIVLASPSTIAFSFQDVEGGTSGGSSVYQSSTSQGIGTVTLPGLGTGGSPQAPLGAFTGALIGSPVSNGSGQYLSTYQVNNLSGIGYGTGSFITFDDITGLISLERVPANWSCSMQLVGKSAPNTTPTDSPAAFNATCTYTGASVASGAASSVADFTFLTASGDPAASYYSSEVFNSADPALNNQVVGLVGQENAVTATTPEPATAGPCAAFVLATALFAFARRKRSQTVKINY